MWGLKWKHWFPLRGTTELCTSPKISRCSN